MSETPSQMSFADWDLPEEPSDATLSIQEIQARLDKAKQFIENPENWPKENGKPAKPFWLEHYVALMEGMHFPFRAAVLAAWLATPKKLRWPKTQAELADMLGLTSDRQFSVWRQKNREINEAVQAAWRARVMDGLSDSVDAMLEVAAMPDYKSRGDRELHFKMANVLEDKLTLNTSKQWADMTYDEKLQEIRRLGGGVENPQLAAALDATEKAKKRANELKAKEARNENDTANP